MNPASTEDAIPYKQESIQHTSRVKGKLQELLKDPADHQVGTRENFAPLDDKARQQIKNGVTTIIGTRNMHDIRKTEEERMDGEIYRAEEIIELLKNQDNASSTDQENVTKTKTHSIERMETPAELNFNRDIQTVIKDASMNQGSASLQPQAHHMPSHLEKSQLKSRSPVFNKGTGSQA